MKKMIAIGAVLLVLALGGVTALAAGTGYVDADGDGVCDNRPSGAGGNGAGYVDADGDGVCDNLKLRGANGRHGREK